MLISLLLLDTSISALLFPYIPNSMHYLQNLSVLLVYYFIPSVNGVENQTTPTTSPTSNNEQQLQLTDVSAICDPSIAAITAWLVLVIVSLLKNVMSHVYSAKSHHMCNNNLCSYHVFSSPLLYTVDGVLAIDLISYVLLLIDFSHIFFILYLIVLDFGGK